MFTGIIHSMVPVISITRGEALVSFSLLLTDELVDGLESGASMAVNGVCLTVVSISGKKVSFDAVSETLALSNLDMLRIGTMVNIERSVRYDAEIGGHLLSGHIVDTARVQVIQKSPGNCRMSFAGDARWLKYVFPKGFLGINGASLTVADLNQVTRAFSVNLIPETLARTNFKLLAEGDVVNIEVDSQTRVIVDTVERVMAERYIVGLRDLPISG